MALPLLVNGGAECGPVNPLQGLTKRFDSDRGVQQDHFGAGVPGSSRQVFRTQAPMTSAQAELNAEAARFFTAGPSNQMPQTAGPFDISALKQSLLSPALNAAPPHTVDPTEAWAGDFMTLEKASSSRTMGEWSGQFRNSPVPSQVMQQPPQPIEFHPQPAIMARPPIAGPSFVPAFRQPVLQQQQATNSLFESAFSHVESSSRWEDQFKSHSEAPLTATQSTPQTQRTTEPVDADEFAKVAGLLLDSVKGEENPKFKNSAFLGLMRQVRDREVVVEGNQMVEAALATGLGEVVDGRGLPTVTTTTTTMPSMAAAYKGKGRETPITFDPQTSLGQLQPLPPPSQFRIVPTARRKSVHFERGPEEAMAGDKEESKPSEQLDENDAFWRQENEEYREYWAQSNARTEEMVRAGQDAALRAERLQQHADTWQQRQRQGTASAGSSSQQQEWDNLQADWDKWEASAAGMKPATRYNFTSNNPYLWKDPETRNHALHSGGHTRSLFDSVLEREAAVQRDMYNAEAWYELGVKQQENERENRAEEALSRAVEIDPTYLPAYLALAISYANDGDRTRAYETIRKWIGLNDRYKGVLGGGAARKQFSGEAAIGNVLMGSSESGWMEEERSQKEIHDELVDVLLKMAREAPEGEVDADVQIALGVLLNTGEEYEKAKDCFQAALSVRPEDWVLYNRVGATLANNGNSALAIEYYNHALALNPSYIRARFNLGISCINLRKFEEAAQHILDALVLQDSESRQGPGDGDDKRGVTSSALWDCLRSTCIYLHRSDLAALTELKDLDRFRVAFYASVPEKTDF